MNILSPFTRIVCTESIPLQTSRNTTIVVSEELWFYSFACNDLGFTCNNIVCLNFDRT